jgi:hypothetical protein
METSSQAELNSVGKDLDTSREIGRYKIHSTGQPEGK